MSSTPDLLNQAFASYRAGDVAEAESLLRRAVAAGDDPQAHHALAGLLLETGRPTDALSHAEVAVKRAANNPGVHFQLAQCLAATGNLPAAIKAMQALVRLDQRNPEAYLHLGILYHRAGERDNARNAYQQALHCNPDFIPALNNLSTLNREAGNLDEAASLADHALRLDSRNANALNNLGIVHVERNAMSLARQCFQRALDAEAGNPEVLHNLGLCDAAQGNFTAARESFEQALRVAPHRTDILRDLCQVVPPVEHADLVPRLEKYLADISVMPEENRGDVFFALAVTSASAVNPEKAFSYYEKANLARGARWPNARIENERDNLAAMAKLFTETFVAENRNAEATSQQPVFILGMPRSGTTLVDQVLASHPEVASAGELGLFEDVLRERLGGPAGSDSLPRLDKVDSRAIADLGQRYLDALPRISRAHAARITDKQLINFRYLGLIAMAMPNATIIHCKRDPRDTCLSCYFTDFQHWHYFSHDLVSLGEFYRLYEQYMQLWETVLPGRILTVEYESLVDDLETEARRMIDFCDLDWDSRCLEFEKSDNPAKTASYFQVRQKVHKNAIGRYKQYEVQLKPLLDVLAP